MIHELRHNLDLTRLPPVHAGHLGVPGAHRETGRGDPHQLAPLHPRKADSEWSQGVGGEKLRVDNSQILIH